MSIFWAINSDNVSARERARPTGHMCARACVCVRAPCSRICFGCVACVLQCGTRVELLLYTEEYHVAFSQMDFCALAASLIGVSFRGRATINIARHRWHGNFVFDTSVNVTNHACGLFAIGVFSERRWRRNSSKMALHSVSRTDVLWCWHQFA